jgi:hypothetical protein
MYAESFSFYFRITYGLDFKPALDRMVGGKDMMSCSRSFVWNLFIL